jgi:hypothetical protein
MSQLLPAVYEGQGLIRLTTEPEGLRPRQSLTVLLILEEDADGWPDLESLDEEARVRVAVEAADRTFGMVAIANPEWAREVSEGDQILEWNWP